MTRKQRKDWEKRFKPFYETREKEQILNQHLKLIMNEDKGLVMVVQTRSTEG